MIVQVEEGSSIDVQKTCKLVFLILRRRKESRDEVRWLGVRPFIVRSRKTLVRHRGLLAAAWLHGGRGMTGLMAA